MIFDDIDKELLKENYDYNILSKVDSSNASEIYNYLVSNGIYYAKDIFISNLDLFLLEKDDFIKRFERLKKELGSNYVELLGEDCSLIESMYKD